jgi:acyl-CoA synthetase (AMP-forming)/AMP-acid ligase II
MPTPAPCCRLGRHPDPGHAHVSRLWQYGHEHGSSWPAGPWPSCPIPGISRTWWRPSARSIPACLHGVPTLFIALLHHPDVQSGKAGIDSMKLCWSAAAPLMAETKQRFEQLTGGWLLEAYAMTETMLAAVCCPIHGTYKEGSVGVPAARRGRPDRGRRPGRGGAAPRRDRGDRGPGAADHGRLLGAAHRDG